MKIGVVTEVKQAEQRVALTPAGAQELVTAGHHVLVHAGAGASSGFVDDAYAAVGAQIASAAADVWRDSDLLLKVKEPVPDEYPLLNPNAALFTYLHLAAEPRLADALVASGTTAIGYETVTAPNPTAPDRPRLPLLTPMSDIAGRLARRTW